MDAYQAQFEQARRILKEERNAEAARSLFVEVATARGIPLAEWSAAAHRFLDEGNVGEAAKLYVSIIKHNPTDIDALIGLARASLFMGLLDEAEAYLLGVRRMEPEAAELFLLQGLVHEGRGQLEKAAEQLQEAIVRNPDLVLPYYNLGRVMAQLGEFVPAIRCLTRVTEMEPENVDAYYMLGIAFHEYGDLPSAIASFNRVVQLQPDHLDGYATLADLLVEVGDLPLAMEALNAGLNECQHHASLLEKASAVCMHAGKFANALEYTEQIVETMPTYERGWLNLAHLCILTEDLERSEEAGKQAIACAPDGWEGYYHLGNLYEATKLFDLAEEHYRLAVSRAPSEEFRPMANLAAVLMQVDDKEKNKEAVSLLEEVLPLVPPGDYRFHFNLALAHGKLGARNVAKRLIKEIREALPEDDELVGAAEALENNLFSAKEQLDMSLALESMMTGGRPRPISPVGKPVAKDDKDKSPKK